MRHLLRPLLAVAATAAGALLAVRAIGAIDTAAVGAAIAEAPSGLVAVALCGVALTIGGRLTRSLLLLRAAGSSLPHREAAGVLLAAWWANCVLPARAGDALRIAAFRAAVGGGRSLALAAVERGADVAAIALTALAAAALTPSLDPRVLPLAALVLAAAAAGFVALVVVGRAARRLPERAARVAEGVGAVSALLSTRAGLTAAVCSLAAFAGEVLRFGAIAVAVGAADGSNPALLVAGATTAAIASALPLTPAGLGIGEAGVAALMTGAGADPSAVAALLLVDRACSTGSVLLVGAPAAFGRLRPLLASSRPTAA
jgi:uncharacterized protein (TIRG00374 family)